MRSAELDVFVKLASENIYAEEGECLIQLCHFIYINIDNRELCKEAIDWVFTRIGRCVVQE